MPARACWFNSSRAQFMQKALRPPEGLFRFVVVRLLPRGKVVYGSSRILGGFSGGWRIRYCRTRCELPKEPARPRLKAAATNRNFAWCCRRQTPRRSAKERATIALRSRLGERPAAATHRARRRSRANCAGQRADSTFATTQSSRLRRNLLLGRQRRQRLHEARQHQFRRRCRGHSLAARARSL